MIKRMLQSIILLSIELASLCVPALVNGWPLLFPDSRGYYRVGWGAVDKVLGLFDHHSNPDLDVMTQHAKFVRSLYYSLFVYLPTHLVSIWLVVVMQAAIVAFVLRFTFALYCPNRPRWQTTLWIVFLALATPLSWSVSNIMPDVFTPIMVLCLVSLMLFWAHFSVVKRGVLLATVGASVVMHATNLPIALGVLVICWVLRRRQRNHAGRYIVGAIGAAFAAMLMIGVVGFKEWTLTPHSPPFLLASSVGDGPGRLYLRQHCPQIKSVMCRYLDRLDSDSVDFLWAEGEHGVYMNMSGDEQTQIRAEDKHIFIAAALEHPWMQVEGIIENTMIQLVLFTNQDYHIPSHAAVTSTDIIDPRENHYPPDSSRARWTEAPWQVAIDVPIYLLVVASGMGGIVLWAKGMLDRNQRDMFLMIGAAVVLNATISALVIPSSRYEARVIWLIPMATSLFLIKLRTRKEASV